MEGISPNDNSGLTHATSLLHLSLRIDFDHIAEILPGLIPKLEPENLHITRN